MHFLRIAAVIVFSYLIGSLSVAVIVSKNIMKKDVRGYGSKNAGATNMSRVFGLGIGFLTLGGDFLKTIAAMLIGRALLGNEGIFLSGAFCLIGHTWPIYYGFKGGKGVAVGAGIAMFLDWRLLAVLVVSFAIAFAISKRVSVGSLVCAIVFTPALFILGERSPLLLGLGLFAAVLVIAKHTENIKRLISGTEPKFKPGSLKDAKDK